MLNILIVVPHLCMWSRARTRARAGTVCVCVSTYTHDIDSLQCAPRGM
jgi:hypothetical protein